MRIPATLALATALALTAYTKPQVQQIPDNKVVSSNIPQYLSEIHRSWIEGRQEYVLFIKDKQEDKKKEIFAQFNSKIRGPNTGTIKTLKRDLPVPSYQDSNLDQFRNLDALHFYSSLNSLRLMDASKEVLRDFITEHDSPGKSLEELANQCNAILPENEEYKRLTRPLEAYDERIRKAITFNVSYLGVGIFSENAVKDKLKGPEIRLLTGIKFDRKNPQGIVFQGVGLGENVYDSNEDSKEKPVPLNSQVILREISIRYDDGRKVMAITERVPMLPRDFLTKIQEEK